MTNDLKGVFICDLGIAKLKYSQATVTTSSTNVKGTYPYMAPEMFGTQNRGTAVDVYSLGCVYIELFGENKVWPGITDGLQIMQKVCGSYNCPPTMPQTTHLPTAYRNICDGCCQLDAKRRLKIEGVIELLESNTLP